MNKSDLEKQFNELIAAEEARQKAVRDHIAKLEEENPKTIYYPLNWHRIGSISVHKGTCEKCNKETKVASFGEDEYGCGSVCQKCINDLFK